MNPRILFLVPSRTELQEEMKRLLTSVHNNETSVNFATFERVDSETIAWLMQNGFLIRTFPFSTSVVVLW